MTSLLIAGSLAHRVEWSYKNAGHEWTIDTSGYIDGNKLHLQFNSSRPATDRSLLFHFKKKGDKPCPSFAVIFSTVQEGWPIAYVAGACNKETDAEPDMMDQLAVDFDREYDLPTEHHMLFKGTVEFKADLKDLASMADWNEVFIRALQSGGHHAPRFETTLPIEVTKSGS